MDHRGDRRLRRGHAEAGERALASIRFICDAILTDIATIQKVLGRRVSG